ncbi:hypothetical protein [Clostridiisalibacter paucivorans]|uniref:hypothetical protein n=1 Tax=Clostridiisalibacter paucivorans TaxID=408753 RepID=UPI00047B32C4|nr:hypothetical protein [Clostridiisalibacter paucivorans]
MDNLDKVLNTLKDAGEPLKSKDIAEKSGIEKKEIDKAIKKLKKEEKIFSPKRCYYDIKVD